MKARSTGDEMRSEYGRGDLGTGVRGKYHADYVAGSNIVLLDPDVATVFGTPKAVNDALRSLIAVASRVKPAAKKRVSARPRRPGSVRRA